VVAGKRFPSAVARNRARRVTREACRVLLRDAQEPWDLVLVVRAEAVEQPYQQRLGGLAGLFRRAGVLSDKIVAVP
jgi:ribonuclease P protein component